jgi:hypothetical protein
MSDKRKAVALIGLELQQRGWKLFGWRDDASDSQSDYYSPEHWDGVAVKDDCVVCVDSSAYLVSYRSEKAIIKYLPQVGPVCPHCDGTGVEPGALTLAEARLNPDKAHAHVDARAHGRMVMFNVVSPLNYTWDGAPHCLKCHGTGHTPVPQLEEITGYWPKFQANPPHCTWHVERNGVIVAKGIGIQKALQRDNYHSDPAGLKALCDRIEAASGQLTSDQPELRRAQLPVGEALLTPIPADLKSDTAYTYSRNRDWTWLVFNATPGAEVTAALTAAGWKYSRRRDAWYSTTGAPVPFHS